MYKEEGNKLDNRVCLRLQFFFLIISYICIRVNKNISVKILLCLESGIDIFWYKECKYLYLSERMYVWTYKEQFSLTTEAKQISFEIEILCLNVF